MGAKYSKRTMEISSTPVKPGAPDANGKVADDVTVEKVEDKVTTNGETKAVEETNGSAKKEGEEAAVKAEEAGEEKKEGEETKEEGEEADKTTGEFLVCLVNHKFSRQISNMAKGSNLTILLSCKYSPFVCR